MRYRSYNTNLIREAYEATKKGMSVRGAAKKFGVPDSTLRDRTRGNVSLDAVLGVETFFTKTEEEKLFGHIKHVAAIGHVYTKKNILDVATQYARFLGKDVKGSNGLSVKWYRGFKKRWPQVGAYTTKAKRTDNSDPFQTQEDLGSYYKELGALLS